MKKLYALIIVAILVLAGVAVWLYFNKLYNYTPVATPSAITESYVTKTLENMSLRDKVASLFILHTPGTDASQLSEYVAKYKPSGLILMTDNIPMTTTQLKSMTDKLQVNPKLPLLIATDEEGGVVSRLASDTYPSAMTLRDLPPSAAKQAFTKRSNLLKNVGINLNFGIIADVTNDPESFIFKRVLGTNSMQASERVAMAVEGTEGITLSTLKHFPGHGETNANSHLSIPVANTSYDDWLARVAAPFSAGIKAGADIVMFGQLAYPSVDSRPATLSKKWHQILETELGFKGITITDDMVMLQNSGNPDYSDPVKNSIQAINAGNTLILFVTDHDDKQSMIDPNNLIDGVTQAVMDGQIDLGLINKDVRQILEVRSGLAS